MVASDEIHQLMIVSRVDSVGDSFRHKAYKMRIRLRQLSCAYAFSLISIMSVAHADTRVSVSTDVNDTSCGWPGDFSVISIVKDNGRNIKRALCVPYGLNKSRVHLVSDAKGTEYLFMEGGGYHGSPPTRVLTIFKITNNLKKVKAIEISIPGWTPDGVLSFVSYKYSVIKPDTGGLFLRLEHHDNVILPGKKNVPERVKYVVIE